MELSRYRSEWERRARSDAAAHERARNEALTAIPLCVKIARSHGARAVWLIGSLARGRFEPGSDIDLMVEGVDEAAARAIELDASEQSGIHVDVLRAETLRPQWKRHHERYGELCHG